MRKQPRVWICSVCWTAKISTSIERGQETSHFSIHWIFMESLPWALLRTVDLAIGCNRHGLPSHWTYIFNGQIIMVGRSFSSVENIAELWGLEKIIGSQSESSQKQKILEGVSLVMFSISGRLKTETDWTFTANVVEGLLWLCMSERERETENSLP